MKKILMIVIPCLVAFVCVFAVVGCYSVGWNRLNTVILLSNKGNIARDEYLGNDFITKEDNIKLSIVEPLGEDFNVVNRSKIYPESISWCQMNVRCQLKFKIENFVTGETIKTVQDDFLVTMKFSHFQWQVVDVQSFS